MKYADNHTNDKKEVEDPFLRKMHEIIYEADTPSGKLFDIVLMILILMSVLAVMLESVPALNERYGRIFYLSELVFTILFTVEYILRIICVGRPVKYVLSFFGIVDLLAILPTYLSLLIPGTQALAVIRILRILRVFRVFKLARYVGAAQTLISAMKASKAKITVFLSVVFTVVVIVGSLMHLIEGEEHGFNSIPRGVYWAIVTLTTVGFGDIAPVTPIGQALAAALMILGYGIIAVPTGIVTAELTRSPEIMKITTQACPSCSREGHAPDAKYCKFCGAMLNQKTSG